MTFFDAYLEFMTGLIKELAKNKITSASVMDWDLSGKLYYGYTIIICKACHVTKFKFTVEKFVDELMKDEQVVMQGKHVATILLTQLILNY